MTDEEQKEYDALEKEEGELTKYLEATMDGIQTSKVARLIEVNILLETYCNR